MAPTPTPRTSLLSSALPAATAPTTLLSMCPTIEAAGCEVATATEDDDRDLSGRRTRAVRARLQMVLLR
eukprot:5569081-Lingulodinium_polyedra.AAC.1